MALFPLQNDSVLLVEPANKKLRLVVTNNGHEVACRMETASNIKRFLASAEPQLFKGRLQLHKYGEAIMVKLKGEEYGIISAEALLKSL